MTGDAGQAKAMKVEADGFGVLLLRLFVGSFTILAGMQIVVSDADFTRTIDGLGVPFPSIAAILVVAGHLGLGVLLILGAFTRPVGFLLAVKFWMIFLTYYVLERGTLTLTMYSVGTLRGVESLSYGFVGIYVMFAGAGPYSVDAWLERFMGPRAQSTLPRLTRYVFPGAGPEGDERRDRRDVGQAIFRVFIGVLLLVHGVNQIGTERSGATTEDLADKLQGLGLPAPAVLAWASALAMLVLGVLLVLGLFTRVNGVVLAVVGLVLFLAVPDLAGASRRGYGFNGEELIFLATVGIYFLCTGAGRYSGDQRRLTRAAANLDAQGGARQTAVIGA